MHRTSKYASEWLNNLRKGEEVNLQKTSFVGSIAKGYKYSLVAVSVIGIAMGYFLCFLIQDPAVGMIFGTLGIIALLMLPTYFSYRCYIDKSTLKAEYYIFCFKVTKDVLWKDVEYKVVKRDSKGNALSIRLYNINKKKLIHFDYSIVGFGNILRMAKRVTTLKK